jgi:hypothetical protein
VAGRARTSPCTRLRFRKARLFCVGRGGRPKGGQEQTPRARHAKCLPVRQCAAQSRARARPRGSRARQARPPRLRHSAQRKKCHVAPPRSTKAMQRAKTFAKVTKKGAVVKVVKEHYLRDDVVCGSLACRACAAPPPGAPAPVLSATPAAWPGPPARPHYLVPDTNVFINQACRRCRRCPAGLCRSPPPRPD